MKSSSITHKSWTHKQDWNICFRKCSALLAYLVEASKIDSGNQLNVIGVLPFLRMLKINRTQNKITTILLGKWSFCLFYFRSTLLRHNILREWLIGLNNQNSQNEKPHPSLKKRIPDSNKWKNV